jgi:hypothetical protein
MSFVVYHIESTYLLKAPSGGVGCYKTHYETEAAAKASITRAVKKGRITEKEANEVYRIADAETFRKSIEKQEIRKNLMSGKEFSQPVNTPLCCDPSSETYWSM